jgi:hypothetical protein
MRTMLMLLLHAAMAKNNTRWVLVYVYYIEVLFSMLPLCEEPEHQVELLSSPLLHSSEPEHQVELFLPPCSTVKNQNTRWRCFLLQCSTDQNTRWSYFFPLVPQLRTRTPGGVISSPLLHS